MDPRDPKCVGVFVVSSKYPLSGEILIIFKVGHLTRCVRHVSGNVQKVLTSNTNIASQSKCSYFIFIDNIISSESIILRNKILGLITYFYSQL